MWKRETLCGVFPRCVCRVRGELADFPALSGYDFGIQLAIEDPSDAGRRRESVSWESICEL
jgi:hypothetical protein